ncbi:MAG: DegT/DnrJ/EryC1/StrS family aminotransferase [Acidimicrobiales bacterium]|nr:DegT/DnrJ/EryC1/StrS family aminotransferase [Acidimicrobiales bacterium]
MTPEEFRQAGHALIDWIADYRTRIPELPVGAQVQPGEVRAALGVDPPVGVEPFDALLADLDRIIVPGVTLTQHPRFFGWFPSNATLSSVLGDIASSGIAALGITWQSAPALTELEEACCEWLRELCGLSPQWRGSIHDTASTAALVAMLCARERASDHAQTRGGLRDVAPLAVYASPHAHSSVTKAALLAGFGQHHLRFVEVDPVTYALRADALAAAMERDVAAGLRPAAIVASVGTTGTNAFDPLPELVELARRHGAWLHVDAAMAGAAMLLEEQRWRFEGIDGADSISWNPHKWMGTILDCSLFYVRDPQHLIRVMSTNPSDLRSAVDDEVTQLKDWGVPLGRRFRALKIWFQLRLDGLESIKARLRRDLANAQWLAEQVEATPGWRVLAPVQLQTVCLRHEPEGMGADELDAHTQRWAGSLNASGRAFVTPSLLDGRWMVRVSVGAEHTEADDVAAGWEAIRAAATASC